MVLRKVGCVSIIIAVVLARTWADLQSCSSHFALWMQKLWADLWAFDGEDLDFLLSSVALFAFVRLLP